jgi:hypothetical protein
VTECCITCAEMHHSFHLKLNKSIEVVFFIIKTLDDFFLFFDVFQYRNFHVMFVVPRLNDSWRWIS